MKLWRYRFDKFKAFFKLRYWYIEDQIIGKYKCPKCKCWMGYPPRDFNICPNLKCRVEFGYDWPECEDDGTPWGGVTHWEKLLHVTDEELELVKKRYPPCE